MEIAVRERKPVGFSEYEGLHPIEVAGAAVTVTLRPNGAGDLTEHDEQYPASDEHWDKVDEAVPDEDVTYIQNNGGVGEYKRDLFTIENLPAGVGVISQIEVFVRGARTGGTYTVYQTPIIKTGGVEYRGRLQGNYTTAPIYDTDSDVWVTNPNTGVAWTVADISSLQIGVRTMANVGTYPRETQVYVEVTYQPLGGKLAMFGGAYYIP